ncbi:MAG: anti-sigma factor [Vicinamibacteria bacterium]
MDCESARGLIAAEVDGELLGEERAALLAHLQACPACRGAHEQEQALAADLRAALVAPPAPEALRTRVEALSAPRRRPWLAAAAAAVVVVGLASLVLLRSQERVDGASGQPSGRQAFSEFAQVAVDSHLRYGSGRLPLEVRSRSAAEVSRWFEGRVPFHLTLPDYPVGPGERKFYELEGARLVSAGGDYAAYVAYRMEQRPISLLVASAERVRPGGRETIVSGGLSFHLDAVSGLKVITWSDNGLTYALVSDLSVSGAQTCLVCHGAPQERGKIEGFGS